MVPLARPDTRRPFLKSRVLSVPPVSTIVTLAVCPGSDNEIALSLIVMPVPAVYSMLVKVMSSVTPFLVRVRVLSLTDAFVTLLVGSS